MVPHQRNLLEKICPLELSENLLSKEGRKPFMEWCLTKGIHYKSAWRLNRESCRLLGAAATVCCVNWMLEKLCMLQVSGAVQDACTAGVAAGEAMHAAGAASWEPATWTGTWKENSFLLQCVSGFHYWQSLNIMPNGKGRLFKWPRSIMPSANKYNFTYFFPIFVYCISFSCLITWTRFSSTVMSTNSNDKNPWLAHNCRRKVFNILSLNMLLDTMGQ